MKWIKINNFINIIKNNINKYVEARLFIVDWIYATHFIKYNWRYIYDEWIDWQINKTNFYNREKNYHNSIWFITTITY